MKNKRTHTFLLFPLLFIFLFSWTQASGTVLCVSDSQAHYVKRNPLHMMSCHSPTEDKTHVEGPADNRELNLGTSPCREIFLASANSLRPPEEVKFQVEPTTVYAWPAKDITSHLPAVVHRSQGTYLQKNHLDPSLRSLRTTVLLI